jgi:hypothetical protein
MTAKLSKSVAFPVVLNTIVFADLAGDRFPVEVACVHLIRTPKFNRLNHKI